MYNIYIWLQRVQISGFEPVFLQPNAGEIMNKKAITTFRTWNCWESVREWHTFLISEMNVSIVDG